MVTLKADDRSRVKLPKAKAGEVFIYEEQGERQFLLTLVKKSEPEVEIIELEDLDAKTLAPKGRGAIDEQSIVRAIRADRDAR